MDHELLSWRCTSVGGLFRKTTSMMHINKGFYILPLRNNQLAVWDITFQIEEPFPCGTCIFFFFFFSPFLPVWAPLHYTITTVWTGMYVETVSGICCHASDGCSHSVIIRIGDEHRLFSFVCSFFAVDSESTHTYTYKGLDFCFWSGLLLCCHAKKTHPSRLFLLPSPNS